MNLHTSLYIGATGTATMAAYAIGRPWGFYVAGAMGTLISDPDGMTDSAANWRTDELSELRRDLDNVKTHLEDHGTWEGDAFDGFDRVHASFLESIETLDKGRTNTSEAIGSTAPLYKWGAYLCTATAAGMFLYAWWKNAMRTNPATALAAELADTAIGTAVTTTMRSSVTRHGVIVATCAGVLGMLNMQTQAAGKIFPTLEAIPTQLTTGDYSMPFMGDGLQYTEGVGLTPKIDQAAVPQVPQ